MGMTREDVERLDRQQRRELCRRLIGAKYSEAINIAHLGMLGLSGAEFDSASARLPVSSSICLIGIPETGVRLQNWP
jgi:hypothetical protein